MPKHESPHQSDLAETSRPDLYATRDGARIEQRDRALARKAVGASFKESLKEFDFLSKAAGFMSVMENCAKRLPRESGDPSL